MPGGRCRDQLKGSSNHRWPGGPARPAGILVTIHGAKPGADRPGEQMIRTDRRHGLVGICLSLSADVACVKASDIDHSVGSDELALAFSPGRGAPGGLSAPCRRWTPNLGAVVGSGVKDWKAETQLRCCKATPSPPLPPGRIEDHTWIGVGRDASRANKGRSTRQCIDFGMPLQPAASDRSAG